MKLLILEDEELAAERLQQQIEQLRPGAEVLQICDSVESAVEFLQRGVAPELAFFDIQLADGASFEVFEQVEVPCPVIFTTAYDQYALRAFKVNSVDYLLKPIATEDLQQALQQYDALKASFSAPAPQLQQIEQLMRALGNHYKDRFVVKAGHHFLSVKTADIHYFFSEHKTTWLRHQDGKKYALDYSLEQLEALLDPACFFRVSRKYIVQLDSVQQATVYSNARLKLEMQGGGGEEVLVSRDRVQRFREWMAGE